MKTFLKRSLIVLGLINSIIITSASAENEISRKITLNESIELALNNNRTIEQSEQDQETAKWALSESRRGAGPRLSWNFSAMHIGGTTYESYRRNHDVAKSVGIELSPYDNEFTNSVSITMPLYTGGSLEGQMNAAKYRLDMANLNVENAKQTVIFNTKNVYYSVLQRKNIIFVQEEAVKVLQEHLNMVNINYNEGTVAYADVLASQVQLANSKQNLVTARANYEKAMQSLNNIIGLPANTVLYLQENLTAEKFNVDLAKCIEYAQENRPDGAAADYAIKRAEATISTTKSGYKPSVSAAVSRNIASEHLNLAHDHSETWRIGVQAQWNIFDNGITEAQVEESKAAMRKAQSQAYEIKEQIELEVNNAYTDLKAAEQKIDITKIAVTQAEEDYEIARVRYIEGVGTNLNVMNAQEKLTEAKTNYYTAIYGYYIAKATLDKAIGVPIEMSVPRYVEVEQDTRSTKKALKESQLNKLSD